MATQAHAPATPQHVGSAGVATPSPASGPAAAALAVRFHAPGSTAELHFVSLVLFIPLLNILFPDAFKNWQLAIYEKTIFYPYIYIFLWVAFAMIFLGAVSI